LDKEKNNMVRRDFIKGIAVSGGAALGFSEKTHGADTQKTVQMQVRGLYCPTCAVGLETVLSREEGIISARATYPEGGLTVVYHTAIITRSRIEEVIRGCDFQVTD
jgi:copper chaperone CopZ